MNEWMKQLILTGTIPSHIVVYGAPEAVIIKFTKSLFVCIWHYFLCSDFEQLSQPHSNGYNYEQSEEIMM